MSALPRWRCSRCGTLQAIPIGVDAQDLIDLHYAACWLPPPRPAHPPPVVLTCQRCRRDILEDGPTHALLCQAWSPRWFLALA
jgi:hypothetical protein